MCIRDRAFHFLQVKDTYLKDEVMKYLAMVGIEDKAEEIAGFMSYGDQRRLDIAIALALEPKLLILDEPAAGVAREEAYKLMDLIRKLGKEQHMTIVFIAVSYTHLAVYKRQGDGSGYGDDGADYDA